MTHPRRYIAISLIILCMLACGLPTTALVAPTAVPTYEVGRDTPKIGRTLTICNSGGLNVRTGAGTEFAPLDVLTDGVDVEYIAETYALDGAVWYVVRYNGRDGYINSKYTCE